jgi:hypothetical protein
MSTRPTFRIRGAQSLADAAERIRECATGDPEPVAPRKRYPRPDRRGGYWRMQQSADAGRANRARSDHGRKLVAIDTPARNTRLPIAERIPNTTRNATLNAQEHAALPGSSAKVYPEWRGTEFPVKSDRRKVV